MLVSLFYLILAILGLGFLVFIHELGHYWMALRRGMRVESFGIGFGKPIYSFERKGVRWNICWLPFGGYVKIAGMEKEHGVEPEQIPDGFFGKTPWDRIQVALAGPCANILFAFFLFSLIWATGGREKRFADVTDKIGWIDPHSELFAKGIRPGDEILSYNLEPVHGIKDHFNAAMTGGERIHVEGRKWNEATHSYVPFSADVHPYAHPQALEPGILTTGVLAPASYLIYDVQGNRPNPLPKGSPLEGSGIEYGDRIVWANGQTIYALPQLAHVLNDGRELLTIKRNDQYILRRVPRIPVGDLRIKPAMKEELSDWYWEAALKTVRFNALFFIPYNLNSDCVVESSIPIIESEEKELAEENSLPENEEALHEGDCIVAINGIPVTHSYELLALLQSPKALLIVERMSDKGTLSEKSANQAFDAPLHSQDLAMITQTIGTPFAIKHKGDLRLLAPITLKTRQELFQNQVTAAHFTSELAEEKRQIQAIDNPEKRAQALKFLETREKQLLLGLPGVQDRMVAYNPGPITMFFEVVDGVATTLGALFGGYLNPKWLSGPIGIVQVIHTQWMVGIKEALFWIATISLNLGLVNLLPLPVLDGGYICLSLFEIISGKKLKSKTVEKIIVPFAIVLVLFFVFLTYHDLLRFFKTLIT